MSTQTSGDLKLIKPAVTDNINQTIDVDLPANFEKIDEKVTESKNNAGNLLLLNTDNKNSLVGAINEVDADLDELKSAYASYVDSNNLKVTKVDKELNDFQQTLSQVNINQEAKQSITGYGVVSFPKNAANGNVSSVIKGQTRTNLLKSSNMDKDTNGDGVVDDFIKYQSSLQTAIFSFDATKKSQKIEVTASTGNGGSYAYQKIENINSGDILSVGIDCEKIGNVSVRIDIEWQKSDDTIISTVNSGSNASKFENQIAPAETVKARIKFMVITITGGLTGTCWFKNVLVEKATTAGSYISTGTKSTISNIRAKSIGKNLFDGALELGGLTLEGKETTSTQHTRTKFITVLKEPIYIKLPSSDWVVSSVRCYDDNKNFVGTSIISGTGGATTPIGTKIRLQIYKVGAPTLTQSDLEILRANLQIEKGTAATPYEPYKESTQYISANAELRSLPNGVRDEARLNEGKKVLNVGHLVLNGSESWTTLASTSDFQLFYRVPSTDYKYGGDKNRVSTDIFSTSSTLEYPNPTKEGVGAGANDNYVYISISKSKLATADIAGFKMWLAANPVTLNYQLAAPIEVPIEVSGNLISYPSGTIYIENAVADAGIYTDKFTILQQDLPIKEIEKISKVDFMTGIETEVNKTLAVINADKKSFTHLNLTADDIVFTTYFYDKEGTLGETTVAYYDSRHTLKDSVTGKFYKVVPTVANGVLTNGLVEV